MAGVGSASDPNRDRGTTSTVTGQPGATSPGNAAAGRAYTDTAGAPSPPTTIEPTAPPPPSRASQQAIGAGSGTAVGAIAVPGNEPSATPATSELAALAAAMSRANAVAADPGRLVLGAASEKAAADFIRAQGDRPTTLVAPNGFVYLVTKVASNNSSVMQSANAGDSGAGGAPVRNAQSAPGVAQPGINDNGYTVRLVNPGNASDQGIDVPLRSLLGSGGNVLDASQGGVGTPLPEVATSVQGAVAAGKYTFAGFSADAETGAVTASVRDAAGKTISLNWADFSRSFGAAAAVQTVSATLARPPAAQVGAAVAGDPSLMAAPKQEADAIGLAAANTADRQSWIAAQGGRPFLAQAADAPDGTGGAWSVVTPTADGAAFSAQPLGGGAAVTLAQDQLGGHFARLQSPAGAVGQVLTDAQGQAWTFQGLRPDGRGGASVDVAGRGGSGTRMTIDGPVAATANDQTQSLSISAFAERFGSGGGRSLGIAAQSTPTTPTDTSGGRTAWEPSTGSLFNVQGQNTVDDIRQGSVGDCYLAAAMASLIQTNPGALKDIIKPSADGNPGHYDVRLFDATTLQPHTVTVDSRLPVDQQQALTGLAATTQLSNIAPALIEKAYVVFQQRGGGARDGSGGYAGITGGRGDLAMVTLTGKAAESTRITPGDPGAALAKLERANAGQPVTAGSMLANAPGGQRVSNSNVVSSHAFTVIGTRNVYGQPTVTLRNPWGGSGPRLATFDMSLDEFMQNFNEVSVGQAR